MTDSRASFLPSHLLCSLSFLTSLNLSRNHIQEVHLGITPSSPSSSCLPSLTHFDLSHNLLTSFRDGVFSHLPTLQELFLEGNHLTKLRDGSFSGLTSLSVLNLAENTLHSLPPECLAHSPVSIHSVLRETNLRTSMVLSQHRTSLNC